MGRLGGGEILLILVIALLVFGPSKLADMGKGLGEGLKNFKKGLSQDGADGDSPPAPPPPAASAAAEPPRALVAGTPTVEPPAVGDPATAPSPPKPGEP